MSQNVRGKVVVEEKGIQLSKEEVQALRAVVENKVEAEAARIINVITKNRPSIF